MSNGEASIQQGISQNSLLLWLQGLVASKLNGTEIIYTCVNQNGWDFSQHFYQLLSLPKQHTFPFCNVLFYKRRTKTWALHYTFNCSLMQTSVSTHWSHCSLVDKIICYLAHKARAASSAMQYKKLLNSISVLTRSVEIMVSARCFLLLSSEGLWCFWEAEQLTYMANDKEEEGREKHFIMWQKSGKFSCHTHFVNHTFLMRRKCI